jgi:uncharacterized repeat protein (TIGR03943 family)
VVVVTGPAGGTTLVLVGVMLIRLAVTGDYLRFVRAGMGPWLLVTGAAVIVLGMVPLIPLVSGRRGRSADHAGHHHPLGGDRVAWLLLVPVVVLLLVTPPPLGSFAVDRTTVSIGDGGHTFDPLRSEAGPVPMTLLEFDQRAGDRGGASLGAVPVRLTGFVAGSDGGGARLARYQIACCAADAVAALVRLEGMAGPAPARDAWYTVTGTFSGVDAGGIPRLQVLSTEHVPPPVDPYE